MKKKTDKVVNPCFEKRPKQFGIGGALPPKKDLHRFVKWPKVVRIQRQRRILKQRLKFGISIPTTGSQTKLEMDDDRKLSIYMEKEKDMEGGSSELLDKKPSASQLCPFEILQIIMSSLPLKSIGKFKCLSKTWYTTLSDPYFRRLYESKLDPSRKLNLIIVPPSNDLVEPVSFNSIQYNETSSSFEDSTNYKCPFQSNLKYLSLQGSCNGLLCVQVDLNQLCVWNPCTEVHTMLPQVPNITSESRNCTPPPFKTYGFGWDSESQHYKILHMAATWKRWGSAVAAITLGEKSWRYLKNESFNFEGESHEVVFSNGKIYWKAIETSGELGRNFSQSFVIAAFNINREAFSLTQPPEPLVGNRGVQGKISGTLISQLLGSLSRCFRKGITYGYLKKMKVYQVGITCSHSISRYHAFIP